MPNLQRTREDLAVFLRACRERLQPEDVGLPGASRRRTPGLRREEVASLAGVGVTWYTWLEQGRQIGVSSTFLDQLAKALKLDAAERRHLYLLAQQRPPAEPGTTWCQTPAPVLRLMHDIAPHAAHVLNLRWDVLAFNANADALFGFNRHTPMRRNLLWMLFTDAQLRQRMPQWQSQSAALLASFRRDYAHAHASTDITQLVDELTRV